MFSMAHWSKSQVSWRVKESRVQLWSGFQKRKRYVSDIGFQSPLHCNLCCTAHSSQSLLVVCKHCLSTASEVWHESFEVNDRVKHGTATTSLATESLPHWQNLRAKHNVMTPMHFQSISKIPAGVINMSRSGCIIDLQHAARKSKSMDSATSSNMVVRTWYTKLEQYT